MSECLAYLRAGTIHCVIVALAATQLASCSPDVLLATTASQAGGGGQAGQGGLGSMVPEAEAGDAQGGTDGSAGSGGTSEPASHLLADSVADFSLVQGWRGWYYGYETVGSGGGFELMTELAVVMDYAPVSGDVWDCWATAPGQSWAQLFRLGGHPNGVMTGGNRTPLLQRVIRRWVSNFEGDVVITGELAKVDTTGSNGIDASLLVDGVELYSTFIAGADGAGLIYERSATLALGSTVDFVIDPHESTDFHDLTRFTGVIQR